MTVEQHPKSHETVSTRLILRIFENLTAVAVAVVSRSGSLVEANQAFVDLLPDETPASDLRDVRSFFINPRFDQFAGRSADRGDGVVFLGRLDLGDPSRDATTLNGVIYDQGDDLLVIAEWDVPELQRLAALALKLNEELAEQKRALVRMGREVERGEAAANRALSDREALLDVIERDGVPQRPPRVDEEGPAEQPELQLGRNALHWTDDLGTGIASLDNEHTGMIDHYNAMIGAIDEKQDTVTVRHKFEALMHYTRRHFEHEERVMQNIGYPHIGPHRREHERLLRDAEDFVRGMGHTLRHDDCPAIARYFEYWLLRHTREYDADILRFVERTRDGSRDFAPSPSAARDDALAAPPAKHITRPKEMQTSSAAGPPAPGRVGRSARAADRVRLAQRRGDLRAGHRSLQGGTSGKSRR